MTQMRPYIVALTFGVPPTGHTACIGLIAPSSEAACAAAAATVVQMAGITTPLNGHHCQELQEDFLVAALNAVRGGKPEGQVVALNVVRNEPKPELPVGPDCPPHVYAPFDVPETDPAHGCCTYCGCKADHPYHTHAG